MLSRCYASINKNIVITGVLWLVKYIYLLDDSQESFMSSFADFLLLTELMIKTYMIY